MRLEGRMGMLGCIILIKGILISCMRLRGCKISNVSELALPMRETRERAREPFFLSL